MTTPDLTPKIDQLKAAFITIEANRKLWQEEKKELLKTTLKKIKEESGLDLSVQYLSDRTNSEGVNLTFGKGYSGIYEKNSTSMKSYVKTGGYIVFSQAYNGKVFVIIGYPYIEDTVSQAPARVVGKYNPEDITENFICEAVDLFLEEMIKWETDVSTNSEAEEEASRNPVGFAYGKK